MARLRLLPTAQVMKARDRGGLNTTLVRPEQSPNALLPISVSAGGRMREVRAEQSPNAWLATVVWMGEWV